MAKSFVWQLVPDRVKQFKRNVKRLTKLRDADVVVVSYPKSGRTWLAVMISHVYHQKYEITENKIIRFDNFHRVNPEIPRIFFTHNSQRFRPNAPLASVDDYRIKKLLLLVRDPRDVLVSSYFHFTKRYLPKNAAGVPHARYDGPDGLFAYVVDQLPRVLDFLNDWSRNLGSIEKALLVRYEDLREDPIAQLTRVMSFIGGEFSSELIENAVSFGSFENLRERESRRFFESSRLQPRDDRDASSFKVRRGKVGGYRDYLTDEQADRIDAVLSERLVADLGYNRPNPPPLEAPTAGLAAGDAQTARL